MGKEQCVGTVSVMKMSMGIVVAFVVCAIVV